MACTFTIELSGTADDLVRKAKQMIESANGTLSGDTSSGSYNVKIPVAGSIEGHYTIRGSSIAFEITKKPMLVPCSTIEHFLREQLRSA